jgi:hypothetical protein
MRTGTWSSREGFTITAFDDEEVRGRRAVTVP